MSRITDDIQKILITQDEISQKVEELAARISVDYADKNPLFVGILRGSVIFLADLVRACPISCELDFMAVSSYADRTESSGSVKIIKDLDTNIEDKHVIIVEDILDSGLTLGYIMDLMAARKPLSLSLCALLNKPSRRKFPVRLDYCGFDIPDEFVVGYGLDYNGKYRNLPYIAVPKNI